MVPDRCTSSNLLKMTFSLQRGEREHSVQSGGHTLPSGVFRAGPHAAFRRVQSGATRCLQACSLGTSRHPETHRQPTP
ncbi:hypothetical protein CgunFtcFv8_018329 [Champsocephalus gunnari]|uniref:Uncharacterized protein n=1 Tax=Champsocephalus gunnari TaxID=52237 RepID=A0AAN8BSG6_CHAGU|nr:hypothetical protein CgunFtcFv8_018329 [Champsocephalus gunnari]